ncbi:MAG TPA: hypothetical protein PK523_08665 [Elusimicrobiales bacterium]|nr:hypothetical protein [Elusimicrobiales bacterium]
MKLLLLEIWFFVQIPLVWWAFRRFARRNVTGEMIAGTIIGVFNEFATQPLWDYHFRFNIYKDTPLAVVLGWGVMFTLIVFVSEKLYLAALRKAVIEPKDKRIFIFDVLAASLIGFPLETAASKLGVWSYNYEVLAWDWGRVPFFDMPWEVLTGYCLFMLIAPTFVRFWENEFEGERA